MKIAVLREAGGLGDVVMTEPVVRGLRRRYPTAEILYAGLPEYGDLVARFGAPPDIFVPVDRHARRRRDEAPDAGRRPYLAPLLDGSDRVIDLFCPAFQHERTHRDGTWRSRVECFCKAAGVSPIAPCVRVGSEERAFAEGFLRAQGLRPPSLQEDPPWRRGTGAREGVFVALAPWSCGKRRTWPRAHWRELAIRLETEGATPVVLHAFAGPVRDVAGIHATGLPLTAAAGVLSLCRLAIANDSGILHLAEAVGTPSLSLWGSTNPGVSLSCYLRARYLYRPDVEERPADCRAPCYSMPGSVSSQCREGCAILAAIDPATVAREAMGMLRDWEVHRGRRSGSGGEDSSR